MLSTKTLILALFSSFCLAASIHTAANPGLIPRPVHIEQHQGTWTLGPQARLVAAGEAAAEAAKLSDALAAPLGRRLPVVGGRARAGDIILRLDASRADLGDEGYELMVAPDRVRLIARRSAGLFYAAQTFRQLLPAAAWRNSPTTREPWTAACIRIVDRPRFSWRGLLLDPARHFIPKSSVNRIIDAMAVHKLNRLQLHLTDDQGWRVELSGFPLLTAQSAWRDGTQIGGGAPSEYSRIPHGGYYSRQDVREIVAYAAARHITVVPEVEMPGHARAWLAAYPEFAVFPDRATGMAPWQRWGVSRDVLAPRAKTMEACRRVLDEICDLFPSPWIHTGGDEARRDQWRESAEIQELIRTLGLHGEDELQAWFTGELSRHLASKGRRLVGWDEILAGARLGGSEKTSLASNAVVMSWRGEKGGHDAAGGGHDVIMTPGQWTYLNFIQGPPAEEPLGPGTRCIALAQAYAYEPVPAQMSAASKVLGAQMQLWSEYLPDSDAITYFAFPRACALAESFWSPREGKDLGDFLTRLERHETRLQAMGITHHPLARRLSMPDESGRILVKPEDAVIHGGEIVRRPEGALSGWKDPFTMLAWRLQIPAAGPYRIRLLGSDHGAALQAIIAGQPLRASTDGAGVFKAAGPGRYLLFLRLLEAPGEARPDLIIRGLEIAPLR